MALTTYDKIHVFSKEIQVLYHVAGQLNSLITFYALSHLVSNNCFYKQLWLSMTIPGRQDCEDPLLIQILLHGPFSNSMADLF